MMLLFTEEAEDGGPANSMRSSGPNWRHPGNVGVNLNDLSVTFGTTHSLSSTARQDNFADSVLAGDPKNTLWMCEHVSANVLMYWINLGCPAGWHSSNVFTAGAVLYFSVSLTLAHHSERELQVKGENIACLFVSPQEEILSSQLHENYG